MAPILWQNGALARLKKGETIDKLLYGGYSTISLGYAGLCECTRYMKGVSHTDPDGTAFALKVMQSSERYMCKMESRDITLISACMAHRWSQQLINLQSVLQKRFGNHSGCYR